MVINSPDGNNLFRSIDELESEIQLLDKPKGITKQLNQTIIDLKFYIEDLTMTLNDLESYTYTLETKIDNLESRLQGEVDKLKA